MRYGSGDKGTSRREGIAKGLLRRWGVGPAMGVAALLYAVPAAQLTRHFPARLLMPRGCAGARASVACALLLAGAALYLATVQTFRRGVRGGELVRSGPYAWVRHPLYAAWLWFLLPGIALCAGSWPVLGMPVVAAIVLVCLLPLEERDLASRFGEAHRIYRREVGAVFPRRCRPWKED